MNMQINSKSLHVDEEQWEIVSRVLFPIKEVEMGASTFLAEVEVSIDNIVVGYTTNRIIGALLKDLRISF